ncbi:eukaryotic translation initiation factor 4E-binding protein 1-like isoform X1 [Sparus aurata]|uniref:eukaryotic translation initiation factor 4E-binding protein 1-like isoform X1 n=1 Tax=Sparus aurata TaxID=8175 RepID=UPI0011C17249|nr:eukaryotic translation initiation factor 4E-binding protein 1-like isoform X1 [Sparus aurata]XP_030291963.1 eukaryotic translation initiation factor 4E-binding protein 1-like isoform X1 [Sparus aurata]XP_030291964.1 eukaryotic translation initiation factor 4E-binding protein 1-like isoform X1 [Sparus aurata]
MSAGGHTTSSQAIPAVRRVAIHDSAHMPQDYSTTPGGTMFSTTPGGTRIIYDRKFLLQCRTSPLTRTPPKLPDIPGVTRPLKPESSDNTNQPERTANNNNDHLHPEENAEDAQFEMDI